MADLVRLQDIIGGPITPGTIRRFRTQSDMHAVPTGVGPNGVVYVMTDPPLRGIAVGVAGSGKGQLLRTLVATFVALRSPEQLELVLFDTEETGEFDVFRRLPHNVTVVRGVDEAGEAVERSAARVDNALALMRAGASPEGFRPPDLLVVVGEAARLWANAPPVLDRLLRLSGRGPGLALHTVLATQTPAGLPKVDDWARLWWVLRTSPGVLPSGWNLPETYRLAPGESFVVAGGAPPAPVHIPYADFRPEGAESTDLEQLIDTIAAAEAGGYSEEVL